jgi:Subtilase family
VDIISLSWGLNMEVESIAGILKRAYDKGIILIASASNRGRNHPITFPANADYVFCIGATDVYGNRSRFVNKYGKEKFSTLGEAVSGSIDPNPDHHSGKIRDGSSTAAPIAAGIAALTLRLLRQIPGLSPPGPENWHNMRKMFLAMSEEGSYRYLTPWYLARRNIPSSKARKAALIKDLKEIIKSAPGITLVICLSINLKLLKNLG